MRDFVVFRSFFLTSSFPSFLPHYYIAPSRNPIVIVTFFIFIIKMFLTHPLDLHEIRSRIASSLGLNDLASCACVSQDWNDSFTPPLYKSVIWSKYGPSMESVERHKHLIGQLTIRSSAYEKLSSTFARDEVVSIVLAISTLATLSLRSNNIGDGGAQALSEALKTNSTLATLGLGDNNIGDDAAQALSEALKTNINLTVYW